MSPPTGTVSSPIPIPNQGTGQTRIPRERGMHATPPSGDHKCPLDLSNFYTPQLSESNTATAPLPAKTSASLPISSVRQSEDKPSRLSKTVSPPAGKKSLDSGIGETFAQEMYTFLKGGGVDKSNDASCSKQGEKDIYEDLSRPFVAVPENPLVPRVKTPSTRDSLKASNIHSYENHSIPLKEQSTKKGEVPKTQNNRTRCNSSYQSQNDNQLRDARSNTWPTQQIYDNHKLKDADLAPSSSSCCYDNHKLKSSDTNLLSSDAFYDNWKIKGDSTGVSHELNRPCYENVELQIGKTAVHKHNLPQETATMKPEKKTSLNRVQSVEQSYENCVLKTAQTSYEKFSPGVLQSGKLENNQKHINDSFYENCEILGEGTSSVAIPACRNQGDSILRELSHSLPTNCHCVGVVPDELQGNVSMILERRNPPALTRVGSADAIIVEEDKDIPLSFKLSGDNLEIKDHPVPPPRWKRIARSKRTQSLVGPSQQRWEMTVSPELANALSKRWNETAAGALTETNQFSKSASEPRVGESGVKKPALPPRANKNSEIVPKPLRSSSNAYENVTLRSSVCGNETSLPDLPPKLQRFTNNSNSKNNRQRTRALHYENVEAVNGFHVVGGENVDQQQENDSPPPLPRKLSKTKVPPLIPSRVDLEQKCLIR